MDTADHSHVQPYELPLYTSVHTSREDADGLAYTTIYGDIRGFNDDSWQRFLDITDNCDVARLEMFCDTDLIGTRRQGFLAFDEYGKLLFHARRPLLGSTGELRAFTDRILEGMLVERWRIDSFHQSVDPTDYVAILSREMTVFENGVRASLPGATHEGWESWIVPACLRQDM